MSFEIRKLDPGLYFVATPIGTARDITLRGLDILASADAIAAEDTRTARRLMDIHGVPLGGRPLIAYHDHNGAAQRPRILALLADGKSVACVSEAGTPLIADPGFQLGREAAARGFAVTAAPGPSAVLAALSLSGLPTDRFFFAGFPPAAAGARKSYLQEIAPVPGTLVMFESPKRVGRLLTELVEVLGGERQAAVCRELTKKFEEVRRGTLAELATALAGATLKGEIVVLVDRQGERPIDLAELEAALRNALMTMSIKDAVALVSEAFGHARRDVYQLALKMKDTK